MEVSLQAHTLNFTTLPLAEWADELADFNENLRKLSKDAHASGYIMMIVILAPKAYCYVVRPELDEHLQYVKPVEKIRLKVCEPMEIHLKSFSHLLKCERQCIQH